jgi:hypothetical protein
MFKFSLLKIAAAAIIFASCTTQTSNKSLVVCDNSKYLTYPNGKPFLWIGDTAWELFHRLDREKAVEYLENRAEKGFTVIQAVVLAESHGLREPNAYGEIPLIDLDPSKPNEKYFEHVDFIVNKAEELGLFIGMLPTWGDKVFSEHPGKGPIVFNVENARIYGEFLGKRYKNKPVIWILGGDRNIANLEVLEIWRAMAEGISSGDRGRNLISYHPRGESSSSHSLHNEEWLDFNMYQSGHSKHFNEVYNYANHHALLHPRKPFLDAEPAYEDIAVLFYNYLRGAKLRASSETDTISPITFDGLIRDPSVFEEGFFTDMDVRVHGYWNFLAGACGYTYGNNAVWQMWEPEIRANIPCLHDWKEAMDRPGANDIRHMANIFTARPFHLLIPDQSIIYGRVPDGKEHIQAAIAEDNSFMLIYLSVGQSVMVNMYKLKGPATAWWYDTREGIASPAGTFDITEIHEFTPPTSGVGNDWLLVIDNSKSSLQPL